MIVTDIILLQKLSSILLDMGDTEGEAAGAGAANIPEIELIIKASTIDGRRKGACLFCQVNFKTLSFSILI